MKQISRVLIFFLLLTMIQVPLKLKQTKSHWSGKQINLTSDNTTIASTNFNVTSDGKVTIKSTESSAKLIIENDDRTNRAEISAGAIKCFSNSNLRAYLALASGILGVNSTTGANTTISGIGTSFKNSNNEETVFIDNNGIIKCKSLLIDNEEIYQKTLLSSEKAINSNNGSYKILTGMPNLTNYADKTVNIYVKYGDDQAKKFSFEVTGTNKPLFIEYVRNFNGNDIWHTLFKIENTNSTSWKVTTLNSYVIADTNLSKVNITSSNYMFYIDKITVN